MRGRRICSSSSRMSVEVVFLSTSLPTLVEHRDHDFG